jgi:outer membrane receptor protein involved in Fe transport
MDNVGGAIYALLTGSAPVTAEVGTRIYPVFRPQGSALPAVVYTEISTTPSDTKSGPSDVDAVRVQIDVFSATYAQAVDIAQAVRAVLDKYMGTAGGVVVDGVRFEHENQTVDPTEEIYRRSADYLFRIK